MGTTPLAERDRNAPEITALKRGFWITGWALFGAGLIGWGDRLLFGHLHAGYGNIVTWGLWIALYVYFIGLSAGAFLISSLVYVFGFKRFERIGRTALYTAVVTLILALLSVLPDLGHATRAWHAIAFPNLQSPMAWMILLYAAYFALLSGELWFLLRRDLVRGANRHTLRGRTYDFLRFGATEVSEESVARDHKAVRALATVGLPLAILFHGGVGALFGIVAARPHWHSGLFPVLFLLSALVSGGALLIVIAAVFQDGWERNRETVLLLGKLVLSLLLLDVLFQASEMLVAFRGGMPVHSEGFRLMMLGPHWYVFWLWQLGIGTLIPVCLLASKRFRADPRAVTLAGFLIALGFIGLRLNIVIPGLAAEEIRGISEAIASPRFSSSYFPSWSELLLSAGVMGLGILMFGVGEKCLPVAEDPHHV